jgi:ribonucleoside-diphosphate reductase alpha chain
MLTMDVRHPDILDFIEAKKDFTKITGANISVKITNDFMQAVVFDTDFELKWPIESEEPSITKKVSAKEIWNAIVSNAHQTAEPGVIFWDRQHYYSPSSIYPKYKNHTTNPCSEIAMQGGDSCRLMAINLTSFVENPFTKNAKFNHQKLYEVAYDAMKLMDDLVDLELESIEKIIGKIDADPEPEFIKQTELSIWKELHKNGQAGRRTGLGFTGLADTLAMLGVKYDSEEALLYADDIMRFKLMGEFDASIDMAITRGKFEGFNPNIEWESSFIKMMATEFPDIYERMRIHGRRNVSISTVAPTGSVSILTQTSSGIEPVYQLEYERRRKVSKPTENTTQDASGDYWETYKVVHHGLEQYRRTLAESKTCHAGHEGCQTENEGCHPELVEGPYHNSTAPEISPERRIEIQSIIQKYTTHSISSTINLASNTTEKTISEIYINAWKKGLKGITVYRDGSREGVLSSSENKTDEHCANCNSKNIIRQEGCIKCHDCGATYCD